MMPQKSETEEVHAAPSGESLQALQTDGGHTGEELHVLGKEQDALMVIGTLEVAVEGGRVRAAG